MPKQLVKFLLVLVLVLMPFTLVGCDSDDSDDDDSSSKKISQEAINVDYENAKDFEADLDAGKDLTGKTVKFEVRKIKHNPDIGYNAISGEHLNFVADDDPKVDVGDTMIVKVKVVNSVLGSWMIQYDRLD